MNTILWILQAVLAAFFIVPGLTKVFTTKAGLIKKKMISETDPVMPVRFIGAMEILGVVGIILPWSLHIYPKLTPAAAVGFAIVMAGAFAVHFSKKEYRMLPLLAGVFVVAVIVAWFRFQ